ncbi:MAG: Bax inhibitor-1/YccA family protein [Alphaproteobacteria bacterium]|jgi:FtsH-binding integral membrane protein|nr:Bax inhibitor-1/YccA family protein [Alphaproteobacteria bacterium]
MSKFSDINSTGLGNTDTNLALRSYMLRVYNYMGFGLILTGLIAYLTASTPAMVNAIYGTPLGMVVMFAPLAFILVLSFGVNKIQASTAQMLFWLFCAVMGVSISYIFLLYTGVSITRVFLITAATFLTMSIYGYTTKADLSKMGAILMMALIGIIIAMIVNIFMKSSQLDFAISIIGVIVFTGLTAWDTQRIKSNFDERMDSSTLKKSAILGALALYLNFINLFLMLLRLVGDRR